MKEEPKKRNQRVELYRLESGDRFYYFGDKAKTVYEVTEPMSDKSAGLIAEAWGDLLGSPRPHKRGAIYAIFLRSNKDQ